ncbi:MAG: MBL fold metallo-hydrolase [Candidatus Kapabacteria bacterium]|nr:MBL fold metallo-hydrolase [Candidatus Kapabacteria bacterium]
MRFTLLGTGTSTGVPSVACDCDTCTSDDPRDKRLRTSLLVQSASTTVVIDTSMDFRQQMLRYGIMDIDGVVYTHHHFDHIGGFDDVRPYSFRSGKPVAVYATQATLAVVRSTFPYAFGLVEPTGASVPNVDLHVIDTAPFTIGDVGLVPIPMSHGGMPVMGFRIDDVAYCTDTNHIPESSRSLLRGLDTLILDGLRWQEHPTHFTIDQALAVIDDLRPRQAFLTHVAHQVRHADADDYLPPHVRMAWDGMVIEA